MKNFLNPGLLRGIVLHTLTLGYVRIDKCIDDEVHCTQVDGSAQIVLTRQTALSRFVETTEGEKK